MARNQALQQMASQIREAKLVPNSFSHCNKRYSKLLQHRTQNLSSPRVDVFKLGVDNPKEKLNCRQINFNQFCQIPFKDDIPQFVQILFEYLTGGEDLRKMVAPVAKENKITKRLEDRTKKSIMRQETKRTKRRMKKGLPEKNSKFEAF